MSACYPRLGQNTPLVQTREKKKKEEKKKESLTKKQNTTAALHSHDTGDPQHVTVTVQTPTGPAQTILKEKAKKKKIGER